MLEEVDERPTEGQWVEMWEFEGEVWADTCRWVDGRLMTITELGDFVEIVDEEPGITNRRYFVIGQAKQLH